MNKTLVGRTVEFTLDGNDGAGEVVAVSHNGDAFHLLVHFEGKMWDVLATDATLVDESPSSPRPKLREDLTCFDTVVFETTSGHIVRVCDWEDQPDQSFVEIWENEDEYHNADNEGDVYVSLKRGRPMRAEHLRHHRHGSPE